MRNDTGKALNPWAYDEATETVTVFIPELQRECQIMNYARRRTGDWFLDTGSIPVRSTIKKVPEILENSVIFLGFQAFFMVRIFVEISKIMSERMQFKIMNPRRNSTRWSGRSEQPSGN